MTNQSAGSFNTFKHSFEAGTGKILNNLLSVSARYSIGINSDGYIDRAFLNQILTISMRSSEKGNTKLRFLTFGGKKNVSSVEWN